VQINNDFYDHLGDRWYTADDDPVALLRAEGRAKVKWCLENWETAGSPQRVLDVGCGGGLLPNALVPLLPSATEITGVDLSAGSLEVARRHDPSGRIRYLKADALHLPFKDGEFDTVFCMDFLEHVEDPAAVITEISRVLKPGGTVFLHTFNRNPVSWLIAIRGVEWFVKNVPPAMHLYRLFVRPAEMKRWCRSAGLEAVQWTGMAPRIFSKAFWKLLRTGVVPQDFEFQPVRSRIVSYVLKARKPA
jgi:2-polyprenyl-6-hydroxyphenyl methylase/3-demethylubiquinone-9 3-methyltransferase